MFYTSCYRFHERFYSKIISLKSLVFNTVCIAQTKQVRSLDFSPSYRLKNCDWMKTPPSSLIKLSMYTNLLRLENIIRKSLLPEKIQELNITCNEYDEEWLQGHFFGPYGKIWRLKDLKILYFDLEFRFSSRFIESFLRNTTTSLKHLDIIV